MWVEVHCGSCGGRFGGANEIDGWRCKACGHEIVPSDLVDADDWKLNDGELFVLDMSL
ncbi:hypothetical protein [Streptomyces sp. R44]|uniref:Uncharacterized protein n=1 Tax=Streptomyces sp. R44 TaxID=3238633 RepID=A0AB39T1V8_9ACTN